jgi:hypothetical protein
MANRILSAHINSKKDSLKVIFKGQELGRDADGDVFDFETSKKTNQEIHRDLLVALQDLVPHLLFSTELIDESVAIPTSIDDSSWFMNGHWEDDSRLKKFKITGIKTFGKHAIEGIYIYGHKETSHGDIVDIKSPLISLDRDPSNKYPLHVIFGAQIERLITEIEKYVFEGKNVKTIEEQLSIFPKK